MEAKETRLKKPQHFRSKKISILSINPFKRRSCIWSQRNFAAHGWETRQSIERGWQSPTEAELIILAPGVRTLGEDNTIDVLLNKYGYTSTKTTLEQMNLPDSEDLRNNRSVVAHIIHGVSDGRFTIKYAFKELDSERRKNSRLNLIDYDETIKKYDPSKLKEGYNIVDGEEIYYISNPALGLWADRSKF